MLTLLSEATRASSGGKASALGRLLRKGLPVPDGFVIPKECQHTGIAAKRSLLDAVTRELARMGDPAVAVRSSGTNEDTAAASAAGQYESVIGVRGEDPVFQAIEACWASAHALRSEEYWTRMVGSSPHNTLSSGMAVLVQPVIEADASGVMFTPQQHGDPTRIEASWGLGLAVVGGTVTPDNYEVAPNGTIGCSVGSKQTRIDLDHEHGGVAKNAVAPDAQNARTLDNAMVTELVELGSRIARILGGPQDIEWAVADGTVWILQARPITATVPSTRAPSSSVPAETLTGTPGSHGTITAAATIVLGPSDFTAVERGDIVVCPFTDPAWTPLFTIAAGVVTESGGALSHAAIVAREYDIPAVLGVTGATTRIENGARITLDGTAGTITVL